MADIFKKAKKTIGCLSFLLVLLPVFFLTPSYTLALGTGTGVPAGWDDQTYANFKAANPGQEPDAEDTARMQAAGEPSQSTDDGSEMTDPPADPTGFKCGFTNIKGCFVQIMKILLVDVPAYIFNLFGIVFDSVVALSFSPELIKNMEMVDKGWVICRDIANTFFIFILLYIAISTILFAEKTSTKQLMVTLIITALMINFSLYITRFVIDTGNVIALEFYDKLGDVDPDPYIDIKDVDERCLSCGIAAALDVQQIMDANVWEKINGSATAAIFIFFCTGIVLLVSAYALLVASFIFLARILVFWLCMIASPLAFFSLNNNTLKGMIWGKWKDELIHSAFAPAVFLFFFYLIMILAQTEVLDGLFDPKAGGGGTRELIVIVAAILLKFAFIIGLLFYAVNFTKNFSGVAGQKAGGIGGKIFAFGTGAAIGTAAMAGRSFVGGGAKYLQTKYGSKLNAFGKSGQYANAALDKVASSSFDVRAAGVKGIGEASFGTAGGKGGYAAAQQAKQTAINKRLGEYIASGDMEGAAGYLASQRRYGSGTEGNRNLGFKGVRLNPDEYAFEAFKNLKVAEQDKLIEKAPEGATKEYLKGLRRNLTQDADTGLTGKSLLGHTFGQKKAALTPKQQTDASVERATNAFNNEKGTPEEKKAARLEALRNIKDEGERAKFWQSINANKRNEIRSEEKRDLTDRAARKAQGEKVDEKEAFIESMEEKIKGTSPEIRRKFEQEAIEEKRTADFEVRKTGLGASIKAVNEAREKLQRGEITDADAKAIIDTQEIEIQKHMKGLDAKVAPRFGAETLTHESVAKHLKSDSLLKAITEGDLTSEQKDEMIGHVLSATNIGNVDEKTLQALRGGNILKDWTTSEQKAVIEAELSRRNPKPPKEDKKTGGAEGTPKKAEEEGSRIVVEGRNRPKRTIGPGDFVPKKPGATP